MKQVLLVYVLIIFLNFALSKDIIGSEGIPSHWKRYRKSVNNLNYHKPHYLPNKILDHYETSLQDLNKIISSKSAQSFIRPYYKTAQPILNHVPKNSLPNLNDDPKNVASSGSDRDEDRQDDEKDKTAGNQNKEMEEESKAVEQEVEKTSKDANTENNFKSNRRSGLSENPMHILHQHRTIPLRQTRQVNSANERTSKGEELQNEKHVIKRSDIDNSESLLEETHKKEEYRDDNEYEDKGANIDNIRKTGNMGNLQPIYSNDQAGWIRYRFMANQFALPNRNYINQLFPYTKTIIPFTSYKPSLI